jgi:putative flippase GtrA
LPGPKPWSEAQETRKQLARFLVVGTVSVLVDLAAYRLFGSAFGWRMDIAKGISYWAGVVVGFIGNKAWTFESSSKSLREPISYVALYAVTMIVNIACNRAALAVLGSDAVTTAFLFATGVTTVLNFLGMKLVTFRQGVDDRRNVIESVSPKQQAA